jgi:tetraacyldisaccharide 4'-kinase
VRELLFPITWAYQWATGMRNWLFDHNLRKSLEVGAKVIAVGNVTVGGTGKTPVTLALIELLKERDYSCGVVSRGYKRSQSGVKEVTYGPGAAMEYGDEPVLVKTAYPQLPVWVGEKRVAAARRLLENQTVQFLLCDDAFQHRSLKRDLNLLLLDATEQMRNYRVLPVGRARESLVPALKRADYFVVTKTNLAEPQQLQDLIYWLKGKSDKPVLLAAYEFKAFRSVSGQSVPLLKDQAYLVSGIARPETIEKVIDGKVKVVKHKIFEDHHRYTHLEIEAILDEASQLQARWIVTTSKDATKLAQFRSLNERLWVIDLGVKFDGDVETLYADIDRLAGSRA